MNSSTLTKPIMFKVIPNCLKNLIIKDESFLLFKNFKRKELCICRWNIEWNTKPCSLQEDNMVVQCDRIKIIHWEIISKRYLLWWNYNVEDKNAKDILISGPARSSPRYNTSQKITDKVSKRLYYDQLVADVKMWIASTDHDFFSRWINFLPSKWWQ